MNDLIAALEQATGPSRELDDAISTAIGNPPPKTGGYYGWEKSGGSYTKPRDSEGRTHDTWSAPHYTSSLDSALTLVPEGWAWFVQHIGKPFTTGSARLWIPAQWTQGIPKEQFVNEAATPALALCIAALRAREAQKEEVA